MISFSLRIFLMLYFIFHSILEGTSVIEKNSQSYCITTSNIHPSSALLSSDDASVELEVICGSMFSGKSSLLLSRIDSAQQNNQNVQIFKHSLDDRYTHINKINTHNGLSSREDAIKIKCAKDILSHLKDDTEVIAIDEAQFLDDDIISICQYLLHDSCGSKESFSKKTKRNLKKIIVAGLDLDFRGEPFGPMPQLMALAHNVVKLHAKCVRCGCANSDYGDHNNNDENDATRKDPQVRGGGQENKHDTTTPYTYSNTIVGRHSKCSTVTQRMVNGQPANYKDEIIMVGAKEVYEARCRKCFQILDAPYQNME